MRVTRAAPRKAPNVFESRSEGTTSMHIVGSSSVPKVPSLATLNARVNSLRTLVKRLTNEVEEAKAENVEIRKKLDSFRLGFKMKIC